MSATDILRDALFGNPPSSATEPSREGVLAAFAHLDRSTTAVLAGIVYYATGAERAADTSRLAGTIGKAANEADFYRREGAGWVIDNTVFDGVASVVQPQIDAFDAVLDLLKRNGAIYPWRAPYVDGATLRFPRFLHRMSNGFADRAPASGIWYETPIATDNESGNFIVYYDVATNAILAANIYAQPAGIGGDNRPVIGQLASGNFSSVMDLARLLPNDFGGNISDRPGEVGPGTFSYNAGAIGELAALGIYQGWVGTGAIVVGGQFAEPAAPFVFARAFVRVMDGGALVAPSFESYTADHVRDPAGGVTFRGAGILEKQYSATLASYLIPVKARAGGYGLRVTLDSTGRQLMLAGIQFTASHDPSAVISVAAMAGAAPDVAGIGAMFLPTELAFMEDRPFALYPTQMIDRRPFGGALITIAATTTNSTIPPMIGLEAVRVDPAGIPDGSTLVVSRAFERLPTLRQSQIVTARKVPASAMAGKTFGVLFMGDSKVDDFDTAAAIETMLEGYGATVTRTGTLNGGGVGNLHEGRSAKRLADYVGKRVDNMAFTTPANYIAAPNFPNRYNLNPFLFAGTGTGSFGGYIFDYVKYLAAYSSLLAAHDVVVIDLGTNDRQDYTSEGDLTGFVDVAYTRIITSIREAGKKVIVAPVGCGWDASINEIQRRGGYAVLRGVMRAVRRFNDPANVRIAGAWAQMDPYAFGSITAANIDADTGVSTGALTDPTHPKGSARMQNVACVAAHIAHVKRL